MRIFAVFFCCVLVFASDVSARDVQKKYLDIQDVKSPSGISAWLVEDHSVPVIAIKFAFRGAGSKNDPDDKQGLARMLSNTLDEGAGDLDAQGFQKALSDDSISLSFGASRDHFTGQVKTLTLHKDRAFELLELALMAPRFEQEAIERMRAANKSRINASRSDPQWIAARLQNDRLFEGHPYALNSGGTLSSLDAIKEGDLRGFLKYLGKENLIVAASGDITAEELGLVLDRVFGGLPEGIKVQDAAYDLQNAGKSYVYTQDIPQTVIEIAQNGIGRADEGYYPAQIMNFILGESGFGSRLMEEIREKRGLTYGIYSYFRDYDDVDVMQVSTSTKNESVGEMLVLIKDEWQKMIDAPVSDKELADAKSYIIGSLPLQLTSTDSIADIILSLQLDHLPITYLDERADKINAVTAADIQNAARNLLDASSFTTILVGKPEGIEGAIMLDKLPNVE